jgi:hypothetical protein
MPAVKAKIAVFFSEEVKNSGFLSMRRLLNRRGLLILHGEKKTAFL